MRADAARNREVVLAAADRLFAGATDPDAVSMDAIAAAAGVGKGTLFRGFGDRSNLVRELYERRAAAFAASSMSSSALEGGDPAERAAGLLESIWRFKGEVRVLGLALEGEGSGSPYRTGTYDRWHALLTGLVTEARGPADAPFLAHALLAVVRSDLVEHLRGEPEHAVRSGLEALAVGVLRAPPDGPRRA